MVSLSSAFVFPSAAVQAGDPSPSLSAWMRSALSLDGAGSMSSAASPEGAGILRLSPTLSQLTQWLRQAQQRLIRHRAALEPGVPEVLYVATSLDAETLGTGFALMGDWEMARCYWQRACQYGLQPLRMAQERPDDDPVLIQGTTACDVLRLVVCALAAGDRDLQEEILQQYPTCPLRLTRQVLVLDGMADSILQAMAACLAGYADIARQVLQLGMGQLPEDPALSGWYQGLVNMAWALLGILNQDQDTFNAGLMGQLAVHYQWALCSGREMEETYICLSAVAMVNLGLQCGLEQQVFDLLIPQGLICQTG
ncbi:hypothetical protein QCD60_30385 [Pokkaliibacter sp. MBI-7]|uniref:hypothetical protein n=1 Tax=Pokkaliibacter sp. MBI-7 TaxID=3040600 RepID=UPI002449BE74|nr:hypothetical protein [Pokkaliibacter sp. MBI-7]MDH2436825.1 hypothetical protein [Pokkaliibacter sp. MBI-7]